MSPSPIEQGFVVLSLAGGVLLGAGLAIVAWRRRETPAASASLRFLVSSTIWCGLWLAVVLLPPTAIAVYVEVLASSIALIVVCFWALFTGNEQGLIPQFGVSTIPVSFQAPSEERSSA